jgi:hypothetical protein
MVGSKNGWRGKRRKIALRKKSVNRKRTNYTHLNIRRT